MVDSKRLARNCMFCDQGKHKRPETTLYHSDHVLFQLWFPIRDSQQAAQTANQCRRPDQRAINILFTIH